MSDTTPIMSAVMERINALGDRLSGEIAQVRNNVGELRSEVGELRSEMTSGFRRIERKIDLLNRDILNVKTDQDDLLQRVETLEEKAS